ncbi:MAG: hypothetical protein K6A69_04555 [Lachnospiraceae bacterium]|nr:hypothetical protein [Lachnospiraceae bacterium]
MSDMLTEQQRQQKQQIITDLHKAAEKDAKMDFSEKALRQEQLAYADIHSVAASRMRTLGLQTLDYEGRVVTADGLRERYRTRVHDDITEQEKEESYGKKVSKQETAAKERGEYMNYRTENILLAGQTLDMYKQIKDGTVQAPRFQKCKGDEFRQESNPDFDVDMKEKVVAAMLDRDHMEQEIKDLEMKIKNAPSGTETKIDKVYLKHLKNRLEVTKDMVSTWFMVNSLTLEEKRPIPTEKEVQKAKQHLDLALEKYAFTLSHFDEKYGAEVLEVMQKDSTYKQGRKFIERNNDTIADEEEHQIVHGISRIDFDAMDGLQKLITDHPEEYAAHKEIIDKVFAETATRMRRRSSIDVDLLNAERLMNEYRDHSPNAPANGDDAVTGMRKSKEKELNLLGFHIDAAIAYIRHILTGEKANLVYASYISKNYGANTMMDDGRIEVERRLEQLRRVPDGETPGAKSIRENAIEELERQTTIAGRMRALSSASDYNLGQKMANRLKDVKADGTKNNDLSTMRGVRDVIRAVTPYKGVVTIARDEIISHAANMYTLSSGKKYSEQGSDEMATQKDLIDGFSKEFPVYRDQTHNMMQYIDNNPQLFAIRSKADFFSNITELDILGKKIQALRDGFDLLLGSRVMAYVTDAETLEIASLHTYTSAVFSAIMRISNNIDDYMNDSMEQLLEPAPQEEVELCKITAKNTSAARDADFARAKASAETERKRASGQA